MGISDVGSRAPRLQALACSARLHLPRRLLGPQLLQPAMLLVDLGFVQQHQHFACARDDIAPSQKLDALAQRVDARLAIELEAQLDHLIADDGQALL